MNNLFSKSPETYEKFFHITDMILAEQRHQRVDLGIIKRQLHTLISDIALQKQVDKFFTEDEKDIPEVDDAGHNGN